MGKLKKYPLSQKVLSISWLNVQTAIVILINANPGVHDSQRLFGLCKLRHLGIYISCLYELFSIYFF